MLSYAVTQLAHLTQCANYAKGQFPRLSGTLPDTCSVAR